MTPAPQPTSERAPKEVWRVIFMDGFTRQRTSFFFWSEGEASACAHTATLMGHKSIRVSKVAQEDQSR